MRVVPFNILFFIFLGLLQATAQIDPFGQLNGIRYQDHRFNRQQPFQNSMALPPICLDINRMAAFGETEAAVEAASDYLRGVAKSLTKQEPPSNPAGATAVVIPQITPEQFGAFLLWHNLSVPVFHKLQNDDDPVYVALATELFGDPDEAAERYHKILMNGPATPALLRRWALIAVADPKANFAETLQKIDPAVVIANGEFWVSTLYQQITDYNRRLDLAIGVSSSLERHAPILDQTKLYWALNLAQTINSSYQDESGAHPWNLRELRRRNSINQRFELPELKLLAERRIAIFQKLCEALMRHPAVAPNAFSYWAVLTEHGRLISEDVWTRAEQILLGDWPKDQVALQISNLIQTSGTRIPQLLPAEQIFRLSRTGSTPMQVRFQKTLDALNTGHDQARATGALLSSMTELAIAEPAEIEPAARGFLKLAVPELVGTDPMMLIESLTGGKGGYDALALFRYQLTELKRIPDQIPDRVMMALTGSQNLSNNNGLSSVGADEIRKLLEEMVAVAKEAPDVDRNRTQNALVNVLSTFAGQMQTAWTAVELCSSLDLPANNDPIRRIQNVASSYRLDDNIAQTELFLKAAPVFRDGEEFRIYPSQYLSRQTVLGFLLDAMKSNRTKTPIYTGILNKMKPAFGRDLALAYLGGGTRPFPALVQFCETQSDKIEKLSDKQQADFVFFLNNVSGRSSRDIKKLGETLDFLPWQSPSPFGLTPERFLALNKQTNNINNITNGYPIAHLIVQWLPALAGSPDKTQAIIDKYFLLPEQQRQGGDMTLVQGLLTTPNSASHLSLGLDLLERTKPSTGFMNLDNLFESRWAERFSSDSSDLETNEKLFWLFPASLTSNSPDSAKWDQAFGRLGAMRAAMREGNPIGTKSVESLRNHLENEEISQSQRVYLAVRMLMNPNLRSRANVVNALVDFVSRREVAEKYPELISDKRLWSALGAAEASNKIGKLVQACLPSLSKSGYLRHDPMTTALVFDCASKHGSQIEAIEEVCEPSTLAHGDLLVYFVLKENHKAALACLNALGTNPPTQAPTTQQSITSEASTAFLKSLPNSPVRQFAEACFVNLLGDPVAAKSRYLAIAQGPDSSPFLKRLMLTWAGNANANDMDFEKLIVENSGDLPISALTPFLYHSCGSVASTYIQHSLNASLRHDPNSVVRHIHRAENEKRYQTEGINHIANIVVSRFQNPANLVRKDVSQMVPVLLRCLQIPQNIQFNQRHSMPTMAIAAVLLSGEADQFDQWFETLSNDEKSYLAQRISGENIVSWVNNLLQAPAFKNTDRSVILEGYFSNPLVLAWQKLQPTRDHLEPLMDSGMITQEVLLKKGDWLAERVPQREQIFAAIARAAQQKGDHEKAAESWARAAAEIPRGRNNSQSSQYHLAAAQAWLQLNRPHATLDWLQWHHPGSMMSNQSQFDSVFDQCVEVLVRQDGADPLWRRSRKLLSRNPNDSFALRLSAVLFAREAVAKLAAGEKDLSVALASTAQRLGQLIEGANSVVNRTENVFRATNRYPLERINLIIPRQSRWRYLSEGEFDDKTWTQPGFNASSWKSGQGILGYNESEINTSIGYGSDSDNKPVTTYFRHEFNISKLSEAPRLILRIRHDDAVVCYINGKEVARNNLPDGPITADVRALQTRSGNAEDEYWEKVIPSSAIEKGANVIAVEIHQQSPDSSDHSFDLDFGWLIAPGHDIADTKKSTGSFADHLPPAVWDAVSKVELPRRTTGNTKATQRGFRTTESFLDSGIQLLR